MITLGRSPDLRIMYLELFRNNFLAGKSVLARRRRGQGVRVINFNNRKLFASYKYAQLM